MSPGQPDLPRSTPSAFCLASLDIRQESTRHSDALDELTRYLQMPTPYGEMDEEQRISWLMSELQTRRPLILRPSSGAP